MLERELASSTTRSAAANIMESSALLEALVRAFGTTRAARDTLAVVLPTAYDPAWHEFLERVMKKLEKVMSSTAAGVDSELLAEALEGRNRLLDSLAGCFTFNGSIDDMAAEDVCVARRAVQALALSLDRLKSHIRTLALAERSRLVDLQLAALKEEEEARQAAFKHEDRRAATAIDAVAPAPALSQEDNFATASTRAEMVESRENDETKPVLEASGGQPSAGEESAAEESGEKQLSEKKKRKKKKKKQKKLSGPEVRLRALTEAVRQAENRAFLATYTHKLKEECPLRRQWMETAVGEHTTAVFNLKNEAHVLAQEILKHPTMSDAQKLFLATDLTAISGEPGKDHCNAVRGIVTFLAGVEGRGVDILREVQSKDTLKADMQHLVESCLEQAEAAVEADAQTIEPRTISVAQALQIGRKAFEDAANAAGGSSQNAVGGQ